MQRTAFTGLLAILDEAIGLSEDAVKQAEHREDAPAEAVTLVKVAGETYRSVASSLLKTGSFEEHTLESLTNTLKNAGAAEFLGLMEKLASGAVFPINPAGLLDGDLVEQSASNPDEARDHNSDKVDLWASACREAGFDV